jgi:hypothetical protein
MNCSQCAVHIYISSRLLADATPFLLLVATWMAGLAILRRR